MSINSTKTKLLIMGTSLGVGLLAYYFKIWKTKPIDISKIMSLKPALTLPKKEEKEGNKITENSEVKKVKEVSTKKQSWADMVEEEEEEEEKSTS